MLRSLLFVYFFVVGCVLVRTYHGPQFPSSHCLDVSRTAAGFTVFWPAACVNRDWFVTPTTACRTQYATALRWAIDETFRATIQPFCASFEDWWADTTYSYKDTPYTLLPNVKRRPSKTPGKAPPPTPHECQIAKDMASTKCGRWVTPPRVFTAETFVHYAWQRCGEWMNEFRLFG